jgi:hypothetical protein
MAKGKKTGGRVKGTPNRLTASLKDMILSALDDVGGRDYLARQAAESPTAFLALVGKVLPLQVTGDKDNPLALSVIERRVVYPRNPDA